MNKWVIYQWKLFNSTKFSNTITYIYSRALLPIIIITYYHNEIHFCNRCYPFVLHCCCWTITQEIIRLSQCQDSCLNLIRRLVNWLWWSLLHPMPNWRWRCWMRTWRRLWNSSTQHWISSTKCMERWFISSLRSSCDSNPKHCQLKRLFRRVLL